MGYPPDVSSQFKVFALLLKIKTTIFSCKVYLIKGYDRGILAVGMILV